MLYQKVESLKQYHHKNVILISIAGLTSEIAKKYYNLLINKTNYNLATNYNVRTTIPSLPAPALSSLLTISPLEFHSIDTFKGVNKDMRPAVITSNNLFPTFFYYLKNDKTILFSEENLIKNIVETNLINKINYDSELNWENIIKVINEENSSLSVIYSQKLNNIGQTSGFQDLEYAQEVKNLFIKINNFLINLKNNDDYFIVISSLNGGNSKYIGGLSLEEMNVPHFYLSTKIKSQDIKDIYEITDTSKTIACALNIDISQACIGKIIKNLF